ncbi:MAG: TIR domain-containing protein [Phycisphaerae bacterium]|nr:TIR domain-containing protein [Phycisphaerae bacterium]
MTMPSPIFLSHAHQDAAMAADLARAVEARAVDCWLSERNVPAGADYAECVVRAVDGCAALVVLVTPEADSSMHVRREVDLALGARRPIIPILVGGVKCSEQMRYRLSTAQWLRIDAAPAAAAIEGCADAIVGAMRSGPQAASRTRIRATGRGWSARRVAPFAMLACVVIVLTMAMLLPVGGSSPQSPTQAAAPSRGGPVAPLQPVDLPRQITVAIDPATGRILRATGPVLSDTERDRATERVRAASPDALLELDVNPEGVASAVRAALDAAGIRSEVALRRRANWGDAYLFITIRGASDEGMKEARQIAEGHAMLPASVTVQRQP